MDATAVISSTDFNSVFEALTQQVNIQTITGVLAIGAGVAVGFVFMWWGVRKLSAMLMKSAKGGKLGM